MSFQIIIGLVSLFCFFFLSSWYESYHKVETGYLIALKFGTRKGGVRAHLWLELFTKNNTNMLSRPQGKPLMARS